MNKIVELNKDIEFSDNIGSIESIKINHDLKDNSDNTFTGHLIVSGSYKYGDILDDFLYKLPVSVMVDDVYDIKDCVVSIDEFYYEVVDDNKLRISVDLLLDNLVYKGSSDNSVNENDDIFYNNDDNNSNSFIIDSDINVDNATINDVDININDNIINSEDRDFSIYRVYRVCEGDSLDSILKNFNIDKSLLEDYNDLSKFGVGYKLIIPSYE